MVVEIDEMRNDLALFFTASVYRLDFRKKIRKCQENAGMEWISVDLFLLAIFGTLKL